MKSSKKRKKEIEYQTDLTIYDIFHIKAPEPASVFIEGTDPEFINITITTGATLYTMKLKQEKKKSE